MTMTKFLLPKLSVFLAVWTVTSGCLGGWSSFGDSCYQLKLYQTTFMDAQISGRQREKLVKELDELKLMQMEHPSLPGHPYLKSRAVKRAFIHIPLNDNFIRFKNPTFGSVQIERMDIETVDHYENISKSVIRANNMRVKDRCSIGHLVDIDSDAENDFVFSLIRSGYSETVWIGLNDRVAEGRYVWHSDNVKRVASYTNWESGEPNNVVREYWFAPDSGEDCAEMKRSNGKWNDTACRFKRPFMCEY